MTLRFPPGMEPLARLGFRREGVKRRLLRYGDGWADATLFARLAGDAEPAR